MRQSALHSLQFKLQHGLLDAASLTPSECAAAAERLLCFLLTPPEPAPSGASDPDDDAWIALELLAVMARQPGVAARLLQLGADQALIHVADEMPGCSQPATALLGELLCAAAADPGGHASPAACVDTPVSACLLGGYTTPGDQLAHLAAARWEPAAPSPLPWAAASPVHCGAATCRPPSPQPAGAATALAAGSRRIKAMQLSEDDSQQLFEVALELQPERAEAAGEAALLATLSTLRHGVLADMPAAAVAAEPALLQALLRLVDGAQSRPAAAAAALAVQSLAAALAAAEPAAEGEAGLALAPLAHDCLLRCAALLRGSSLQPQALAAAQALLPLLELQADAGVDGGASSSGAGCLALAPVLAALTEALRMDLVSCYLISWGVCFASSRLACLHSLGVDPLSCSVT